MSAIWFVDINARNYKWITLVFAQAATFQQLVDHGGVSTDLMSTVSISAATGSEPEVETITVTTNSLYAVSGWMTVPSVSYEEPPDSTADALYRVLRHRNNIIAVNPCCSSVLDEALRCALMLMVCGKTVLPASLLPSSDNCRSREEGKHCDAISGLRYVRDRISVPRDMSIYAGKTLQNIMCRDGLTTTRERTHLCRYVSRETED